MSALQFTQTDRTRRIGDVERAQILADPGFGRYYTDFMAHASWTRENGWGGSEVIPFGPLSLSPATAVLHYGQEIFEGLKAFRHADGSVWTFRPERNAERLQRSARRLALPELSVEDFLESLKAVVAADEPWVPEATSEESLYLRPFMFASEEFLGVRASHAVDYYVIASPAGPYFPRGVQPLVVWITDEYARAGAGGTGAAKCGGNYASSLLGKDEAAEHGADEVLFLDSETHTSIDELSGMNVFAITRDGRLLTPSLTGSILEGVTRESILRLAEDRGLEVVEQKLVMSELLEQLGSGEITEMFACGTAAVINPIGEFRAHGGTWSVGDGGSGEITLSLRQELTDIQYGRIPDRHGWLTRLV
ncbi:branched-chain amino acid aminotransferase [Brachybacterium alimentarium]|uniref:branched-chain amino acid aminotransferase n=1 Tax=Brachybacterium alimentarium TaxID=47845 RepID=UPI000DF17F31|nr:branched-chain amino acid aminotransferase [Brachybacterium alimentarium]RCS72014.1 branched-chain amino acid aminotransferase [Brachybacterium alimentarium]RCS86717.1 branched-chain amino acid aminotransferase [Brachybacterium alimentarium]RCS90984.1 branched-chain amino acid aminotransferase [Brachybacterium alimentarium]